jgi:hypothetical protein
VEITVNRRVVLREEDPFYRSMIQGLLAAIGVGVAEEGDVLLAPGSPEDSGRFASFVRLERPLAAEALLAAVEAAL